MLLLRFGQFCCLHATNRRGKVGDDPCAQQKRKHQFILFQQGRTYFAVDRVRHVIVQGIQSFNDIGTFFTVLDRFVENSHKPLQGVLVHRFNGGQITRDKKQHGTTVGDLY